MKAEVFEGSILRGSTKLYVVSNNRKVATPHNALLKISSNETLFKIENSEELNIKKPFTREKEAIIKIKGNYNYKITPGDSLDLYYDEWKTSGVRLIKGDSKFVVGEILYCQGGIVSRSSQNLTGRQCEIKVTNVSKKGEITQIKIHQHGIYTRLPEGKVTAINERKTPIEVELEFEAADNTSLARRDVTEIESSPVESIIKLSYKLPAGVDTGEIMLKKQVIYLDREYNFDDCYCKVCTITKDFSPKNNLPLMAPNTPNVHNIYNKAIEILEEKLSKMENRIKALEKRR